MDLLSFNIQLKFILDQISDVEGDVVELGVYTGNNSIQFMLQCPERKYWGFDTFSGYTTEDIESSPNNEGLIANQEQERWSCDEAEVVDRIKRFRGLIKEILPEDKKMEGFNIVRGDLKSKLPEKISQGHINKISILYVDCNAYLPAIKGIEAAYPIISKGGIICIDEHQKGGETKAIKEAAKKYGLEILKTGFEYDGSPLSNPSKYIIKK